MRDVVRGAFTSCHAVRTTHHEAMSHLIIGYGNPLRGDDGVGWAVVERLEQMEHHEPLTLIASHQLLPELTDLIREAARVTFVDATVLGEPGTVRITRLAPDVTGLASSHQMSPGVLLAYTQQLYGYCPPAYLVTVTGVQFGYEEKLSPLIQEKLGAICEDVVRVAEEDLSTDYTD